MKNDLGWSPFECWYSFDAFGWSHCSCKFRGNWSVFEKGMVCRSPKSVTEFISKTMVFGFAGINNSLPSCVVLVIKSRNQLHCFVGFSGLA